ncbi:MAG: hypothetical protein ACFWTO_10195 [Hafnia paralvei]|jgi:uncharacterized membrane protein
MLARNKARQKSLGAHILSFFVNTLLILLRINQASKDF